MTKRSKGRKRTLRSSGGKHRSSKGMSGAQRLDRQIAKARKRDAEFAKRASKHITLAYSNLSSMKVYSRVLEDSLDEIGNNVSEMRFAILKGAKNIPYSLVSAAVYAK